MNNQELRAAVTAKLKSREKKNTYTQGANRTKVGSGFGDCSATVRWPYLEILNLDIGGNTEAQIKSNKMKDVDLTITNGIPDESKMFPGDCLYFKGDNPAKYKSVGHAEMYIGDGLLCGHGSGIGPTIKSMKTYCAKRQSSNRGLICVRRVIW